MARAVQGKTQIAEGEDDVKEPLVCGIIMPIAKAEGYPEKHWADVYAILCEVAESASFTANLVSFDDDVGIIHKRIVQNIYSNPIIICDISSRNANVMLELGMRLAFDKPTIIVKDDKTPYSFDIAAIEHLEYPSDLRYQLINEFKEKLKSKIVETYKRSKSDVEYTTFLKHFGTFKVAKIDEKEVSSVEFLSAEIKELKSLIMGSVNNNKTTARYKSEIGILRGFVSLNVKISSSAWKILQLQDIKEFSDAIGARVKNAEYNEISGVLKVDVYMDDGTPQPSEIQRLIESYVSHLISDL
ncbi:hypothetical protein ACE38U_09405 [Cedecea sp. S5-13]|uniref:hypothetical protein n=1 Tax=Cedecea selenatireducens TaxID=3144416 RepID=UPI0035CCE785